MSAHDNCLPSAAVLFYSTRAGSLLAAAAARHKAAQRPFLQSGGALPRRPRWPHHRRRNNIRTPADSADPPDSPAHPLLTATHPPSHPDDARSLQLPCSPRRRRGAIARAIDRARARRKRVAVAGTGRVGGVKAAEAGTRARSIRTRVPFALPPPPGHRTAHPAVRPAVNPSPPPTDDGYFSSQRDVLLLRCCCDDRCARVFFFFMGFTSAT